MFLISEYSGCYECSKYSECSECSECSRYSEYSECSECSECPAHFICLGKKTVSVQEHQTCYLSYSNFLSFPPSN